MKSKYIIAACIICSLILGFAVVGIYISFITQEGYSWMVDFWLMIPIAFVIGFIIPLIAYAFMKIGY